MQTSKLITRFLIEILCGRIEENASRKRDYSPRKTRFTNCGKSSTLLIFLGLEMTRQSHSRVKGAD